MAIRIAATALGLVSAAAAGGTEPRTAVGVEGTAFVVRLLPDGRRLGQEELVGAVLEVGDERGRPLTVRVDGFARDPRDPARETVLYRLSALGADGAWRELCLPDPEGERWAFPLAGAWTEAGEHLPHPGAFSVTCTSGAIGKCVRAGYKPWAAAADGTPLWDHHQACVRLFRADYCGDGVGHTRDGTRIGLYDRLGVQEDEPGPGMRFEAAWGPRGAVCVARPRVPDLLAPEALEGLCPGRLGGRTGPAACTEDGARARPEALLFNRS
jgi:hypothetical protein